jgi:glycosyltransferase involved in cell wall biosynthesis
MSISVIIPTYNRPKYLCQALESLAQQTYRNFDVIVVNDGGSSVCSQLKEFRKLFPITLLELEERSGVSCARNYGINEAEGEYVAFLDDDDIFLPQHLEHAMNILSSCECNAAYLGALVSDRRIDSLPENISKMHRKSYSFNRRFLYVLNYIHTGSLVVSNFRDSSIRFDLSLNICEDWDLWLALSDDLGYRFVSSSVLTTIYHQVPGSNGMCSDAERIAPTPFALARNLIYDKWPTGDLLVSRYRNWMTDFETKRNKKIACGNTIQAHTFDRVISYLYDRFTHDLDPDWEMISEFLPQ